MNILIYLYEFNLLQSFQYEKIFNILLSGICFIRKTVPKKINNRLKYVTVIRKSSLKHMCIRISTNLVFGEFI